ncbi:MAG: 2Fe-2S iron-sulfur cluster-binding protein [Thermoplasmata archaeon]|nr:2Fe-2S iron-sulfur cluster-binding protein [Thermoplasmata archaeon]
MTEAPLRLSVNGEEHSLASVPTDERLLDTLRLRLRLTGTKEGCRSGDCGACTVVVDGHPSLSCLLLTHELPGARVLTIEGAHHDPTGARVQHAFEQEGALQCGYCTPGFVLALTGLLQERGDHATATELLEDLSGNLCRCTGYASIVRAVRSLAEAP